MDGSGIGLAIAFLLLLICSAYFSAAELAFSSLNRTRLKTLAKDGDRRAAQALALDERYDELLSTLVIGKTIVNLLAAALATLGLTRAMGATAGVIVATAATALLVLLFAELTPKALAKDNAEKNAMRAAPAMRAMLALFWPLNRAAAAWRKLLAKVFRSSEDRGITEEELLTIVDEAEQEGGLDEHEGDLIRSAIEFNDLDAEDILTHRVDVVAVDATASDEEICSLFRESGFSRLPVYEDSIDNIIGVIHEKDFNIHRGDGLRTYLHPVPYVPTGAKISSLLRLLQKTKCHLAVVTDEYGGTAGIVTLEDIIEELVGEIYDEHDTVVEDIRKLPDGSYQIDCSAEIDRLQEIFGFEGESDSVTVSGWVTDRLGRIPETGDTFDTDGLSIRVTKVDAKRVLEIIAKPAAAEGA